MNALPRTREIRATRGVRPTQGYARACGPWWIGAVPIVVLLAACGDDTLGMPTGSGTSGTSGTTTGPVPSLDTTQGTTVDPTSTTTGPGTGSSDDTGTTGSTGTSGTATTMGGTGEICDTILCGGVCCPADEECIDAQCVAACATEVRCGANAEICCAATEVCLGDSCVLPTGSCVDTYDCAPAEQCDPVLDQCLPLPEPPGCEIPPAFDPASVALQWSWEVEEVASVPMVADVDGDQQPEVIVNTVYATDPTGSSAEFFGEIVVLDGVDGTEQFRVQQDLGAGSFGSYARSTIGVTDVDGDGLADIVYPGRPQANILPFANNSSRIYAVDGTGNLLWSSHAPDGSDYFIYVRYGGPAFVNLDADDAAEIVFGTTVLDNDGTVVFDQDNEWARGGGVFGSNGSYLGGISTVADLTGDGYPEIISGRQAWTVTWEQPMKGAPNVQLTPLWEYPVGDGPTAVADLDGNGTPEVILVGDPEPYTDPDGPGPGFEDGQLQVLDGLTGELWCGIDPTGVMCMGNDALRTQPILIRGSAPMLGGGRGGAPVVADFDGDGRPEIGVAGVVRYAVYDLFRAGEVVVQPMGDPPPLPGELYVRWEATIQDDSSGNTGSAAYDFDGDGASEVITGDECYLRILGGADGAVLFEVANPGPTFHEYSTVADIDDDGSTELLVVASDTGWDSDCTDPGYVPRQGLFAYRDAEDRWARTRQVWSSHTYHVTNATSTGLTPPVESNSWDDPALNDYRQNFRAEAGFGVPDLQVGLAVDVAGCTQEGLEVIATIRNTGDLGAPAGVGVTLYRGLDATGVLVSTQATAVGLPPGAQTTVTWIEPNPGNLPQDYYVVVDEGAVVSECDEADNEAVAAAVACPGG